MLEYIGPQNSAAAARLLYGMWRTFAEQEKETRPSSSSSEDSPLIQLLYPALSESKPSLLSRVAQLDFLH